MAVRKRIPWIAVCAVTAAVSLLAAYLISESVTAVAENAPVQRVHRIVIDAGHGGLDGGATSCTGRLESTYNLEIALRLNDLIRFLGYETVMVRTEDVSVYTSGNTIAEKKISDLKERVRITKETPNSILISIHQNNFPDDRYSGAEVLYADTQGSQELAENLLIDIKKALDPGSRRRCKKASGIYLMEHISCPGILIECGFLSNVQEEAKLRSPEYQKKLCCLIACGTAGFLSRDDMV